MEWNCCFGLHLYIIVLLKVKSRCLVIVVAISTFLQEMPFFVMYLIF